MDSLDNGLLAEDRCKVCGKILTEDIQNDKDSNYCSCDINSSISNLSINKSIDNV